MIKPEGKTIYHLFHWRRILVNHSSSSPFKVIIIVCSQDTFSRLHPPWKSTAQFLKIYYFCTINVITPTITLGFISFTLMEKYFFPPSHNEKLTMIDYCSLNPIPPNSTRLISFVRFLVIIIINVQEEIIISTIHFFFFWLTNIIWYNLLCYKYCTYQPIHLIQYTNYWWK